MIGWSLVYERDTIVAALGMPVSIPAMNRVVVVYSPPFIAAKAFLKKRLKPNCNEF
jgi:hypothetical protein